MNIATAIAFAGSRLDRADHIRSDPERLAALRANGARLLRLDGLLPSYDDCRAYYESLRTGQGSPEARL